MFVSVRRRILMTFHTQLHQKFESLNEQEMSAKYFRKVINLLLDSYNIITSFATGIMLHSSVAKKKKKKVVSRD